MDRLDVHEAKRLFDQGQAAFLDARSTESWDKSDVQIPGAVRVPPDDAAQHLGEIPPAATLITYCT
jgi:rhodanese-related sulfurtransferase